MTSSWVVRLLLLNEKKKAEKAHVAVMYKMVNFEVRLLKRSLLNHRKGFKGFFTSENSHLREFHIGMTFWFRIAFTWCLGHSISCYLTVYFMLIKYTFGSRSQTLRMRCPLQSTGACRNEGDIGIFGFAVLAIFWIGFCAKRLRFFGFGVRFGLRIFRFLASGFRFS